MLGFTMHVTAGLGLLAPEASVAEVVVIVVAVAAVPSIIREVPGLLSCCLFG